MTELQTFQKLSRNLLIRCGDLSFFIVSKFTYNFSNKFLIASETTTNSAPSKKTQINNAKKVSNPLDNNANKTFENATIIAHEETPGKTKISTRQKVPDKTNQSLELGVQNAKNDTRRKSDSLGLKGV